MQRRLLVMIAAAIAMVTIAVPGTAAAGPARLQTGFADASVLRLPTAERDVWLGRATEMGASVMRVDMPWSVVSPSQPTADQAGDPSWSGYAFGPFDERIRAVVDAGFRPLLLVSDAPAWAQADGRRTGTRIGTGAWMPDAAAFGAFMTAVARRYGGSTAGMPTVDAFQIWNEPNLNLYLAPQFDGAGKPVAAVRFRDLVNAGRRSVKAVAPDAIVAAGGLAPYGDPGTSGFRTRPVAFLRSMLCLDSALERRCREKTLVDAISLHPYAVDRPSRSAFNGDDATIPDWKRLTTVLDAARRAGTLGPKAPQRWVTEVSYDSSPPDPRGVRSATRARYISKTLYLLWKQGVNTVVWYLLRDEAPKPDYPSTYQSGMYLRDGTVKPDAVAFRFPVVVTRRARRTVSVWWRSPVAGRASLQVRRAGVWRTTRRVTVTRSGVGRATVPRAGAGAVRLVGPDGASSYAATF